MFTPRGLIVNSVITMLPAVKHFDAVAHTGDNISAVINGILAEYNLPEEDTPVTTDHGANIVAALRNNIRLDCCCHRLHTVLETAWRETKIPNQMLVGMKLP